MSQRNEASRNSNQTRDIYAFVDMVQERQVSEETEPTMDSQQPSRQEESSEPMEDSPQENTRSNTSSRRVASSQHVATSPPMRRSPSPPPSPPAPRAPPQRQNMAMNVSDGRFPAHDPYFHPRLPRNHPFHHGPRLGENHPRPVFGVPPPPPLGMTREERDRLWGIADGLRDARFRVRTQEVMMERTLGVMRQAGDEARMAIDGVRRVNEVIFMMGCIVAALCAIVVTLVLRE